MCLCPDGSQAIGGTTLPDGSLSAVQVDECTIRRSTPGCPPINADAPGYVVWAAHINSMQVQKDTLIFHMKWKTPNVLKTVNGTSNTTCTLQTGGQPYLLRYHHQAAEQEPDRPAADGAFKTPAKATPGTAAEFTSPLLDKDTLLTVTFTGS